MGSDYQFTVVRSKLDILFLQRFAIPFAIDYLMVLTSVKLRHYAASCLEMIPDAIAYCFIDISLGALAEALEVEFSKPTVLMFLIVGTSVVGMIGIIYICPKYEDSVNWDVENHENKDFRQAGQLIVKQRTLRRDILIL